MKEFLPRLSCSVLFVLPLFFFSSCGSGGPDKPFIFNGTTNQEGGSGSVSPPPPNGGSSSCTTNSNCSGDKICQDGHCVNRPATTCTDNPSLCSSCEKCEAGACVEDVSKPGCQVAGCKVSYDAKLTLRIDDTSDDAHFDSPSTCCQYAREDNHSTCDLPYDNTVDGFLVAPSENKDLYCCGVDADGPVASNSFVMPGADIFCDKQGHRHFDAAGNPIPEVDATRYPALGGKKIEFIFDKFQPASAGANNGTCEVYLNVRNFPQFGVDNSAVDASLIIDAGFAYKNFPGSDPDTTALNQTFNGTHVKGECEYSTDPATGKVLVSIKSVPLRFFAQLYKSYTQCVLGINRSASAGPCPSEPFLDADRYGRNPGAAVPPNAFQVIPALNKDFLSVTTGTREANPLPQDAALQKQMKLTGSPLKDGKMTLVAAFALPEGGSLRNDKTGEGQLMAELNRALLTAEFFGTVKNQKGKLVETLADLTTDCGQGSDGSGKRLELKVSSENTEAENLQVNGDFDRPDQAFTFEACAPGRHQDGACKFTEGKIPYAKENESDAGDSFVVKNWNIIIENTSSSTETVALSVPERQGAFHILNAQQLANVKLAPAGSGGSNPSSVTLNVQFEPSMDPSVCSPDGDVLDCRANEISLSSSHAIKLSLRGRAKKPGPDIRLEELALPAATDPVEGRMVRLLPSGGSEALIHYEGQTRLRGEVKTKLLRISNVGVRPVTIQQIQSNDAARNFRLGSIYHGPDFANRHWKTRGPWTLPADGSQKAFFFLNYGPLGSLEANLQAVCPDSNNLLRCDNGTLSISTDAGDRSLRLKGVAKNDKRGILGLYVKDQNRYDVEHRHGFESPAPDRLIVPVDATTSENIYLAKKKLFSFRQDDTTRSVYLVNIADGGLENITIKGIGFKVVGSHAGCGADDARCYKFTPVAGLSQCIVLGDLTGAVDGCQVILAAGGSTANCGQTGGSCIKIGEITYHAKPEPPRDVTEAELKVIATTGGGAEVPRIGGADDAAGTGTSVAYVFKGVSGVATPSGGFWNLKISRLLAGYSELLNAQFQRSYLVSTATRGMIQRMKQQIGAGANAYSENEWQEVYHLKGTPDSQSPNQFPGQLKLDPVSGEAVLNKIITPVDSNAGAPAIPSEVNGIRLFNAMGTPAHTTGWGRNEFFVQCATTPGLTPSSDCGFLYLFIGGWPKPLQRENCNNETKFPVGDYGHVPSGERATLLSSVFLPPTDCIAQKFGDAFGTFDPATGQIELKDLAVRFYSPYVSLLSTESISQGKFDGTMRMSLTTGCMAQDLISDPSAQPKRLVPNGDLGVLHTTGSNQVVIPENPVLPFVGGDCAPLELHGRPMGAPDPTAASILDTGDSSVPSVEKTFDLVGIGQLATSSPQVNAFPNLYIVIKAEVEP